MRDRFKPASDRGLFDSPQNLMQGVKLILILKNISYYVHEMLIGIIGFVRFIDKWRY